MCALMLYNHSRVQCNLLNLLSLSSRSLSNSLSSVRCKKSCFSRYLQQDGMISVIMNEEGREGWEDNIGQERAYPSLMWSLSSSSIPSCSLYFDQSSFDFSYTKKTKGGGGGREGGYHSAEEEDNQPTSVLIFGFLLRELSTAPRPDERLALINKHISDHTQALVRCEHYPGRILCDWVEEEVEEVSFCCW